MIIYIASYPRSGNSLIQQVVHDYFGRPTSTAFDRKQEKIDRYINGEIPTIRDWHAPRTNRSLLDRLYYRFDPLPYWLASFSLQLPSGQVIPQRYLMPGCSKVLTMKVRRRLGEMDSTFFVKMHRPPFEGYCDGEFVILPVRHPGAVLNSLKHFMRDHRGKDLALRDVILGKTPHGNWSEWHQKWLDVQSQHPGKTLLLQFEQTIADPGMAAERISTFLNIPYFKDAKLKDFETLHQKAPKHFRSGKTDAWKDAYTPEDLALLMDLHEGTRSRMDQLLAGQRS
jgi:hypothetical protein